jgi:ACR3 family arsenite efflux pump ArsB
MQAAMALTDFAVVESILLGVAHCRAAAVLCADLLDGAEGAAQALVAMNLRSHTPLLLL